MVVPDWRPEKWMKGPVSPIVASLPGLYKIFDAQRAHEDVLTMSALPFSCKCHIELDAFS